MTPHRESCLLRRLRRRAKPLPEAAPAVLNRKQRRAAASTQITRKEDASGKAQGRNGFVSRDGYVMLKVKTRAAADAAVDRARYAGG